jgi:pyruvate dehydrogenase E1 component beta subunit
LSCVANTQSASRRKGASGLLCRCIAVEEGWPQSGVAAEISAIVGELAFDSLDAPIERVTGVEVPMPYAANLEAAALPSVDDIVRVAKRIVIK